MTEHGLRIPPHNEEAEQSVLGSMLLDNAALSVGIASLTPDSFYRPAHQKVFSAICSVNDSGDPVDQISVVEMLSRDNELVTVGGALFVTELTEGIPSTANIKHYCKIVSDKHLLRTAIIESSDITGTAYDGAASPAMILDKVNNLSSTLLNEKSSEYSELSTAGDDARSIITNRFDNPGSFPGMSTGVSELDHLIGGLKEPDLIVIAARPSVGKTALALQIGKHVALDSNPVGIISLEMSATQIYLRNLFSEAEVPAELLNSGEMKTFQLNRLMASSQVIDDLPIYIDDNTDATANQIIAKAHHLINSKGIKLLIIDYLQLMDGDGKENRNLELGKITRRLKQLCKKAMVPIILLSQLTKDAHGRRPVLKDLRDSGAIEQDIDICLFIHRPETSGVDVLDGNISAKGFTEMILAKNRNGKIGDFRMNFVGEFVRFESIIQYEIKDIV